jgi:hypothetical protein
VTWLREEYALALLTNSDIVNLRLAPTPGFPSDMHARLIAEGPALVVLPNAIQVTQEPIGGSAAPSGPMVVTWLSE